MQKSLYPYVVFLPTSEKQKVLRALFGSSISLDIIRFAVEQGISKKIYQQDLINKLGHSNKSIIDHLRNLTELDILEEHMEKSESSGRIVWLKSYTLSEIGKWFVLLLSEEKKMSKEEKISVLNNVFRSYVRFLREFSKQLNIDPQNIQGIFIEEMGL